MLYIVDTQYVKYGVGMELFVSELEKKALIEMKEFYSSYFSDGNSMENFIERAFECNRGGRKARQMLFQVQRFVSLATEIDRIRPARDGLRLLFFKCCMESLDKLADIKTKDFYGIFASMFSIDGKKYILDNFVLLSIEDYETEVFGQEYYQLSIDDVLYVIKCARDMVVHEGNYWDLHFFSRDESVDWLAHIETNEQVLTKITYDNKNKSVTYHFETRLQFEKFKYYFVEACINFINYYLELS